VKSWIRLVPRHNWKSAQVVNSHLVCDPTIQQPGFDLPRQQWSLLNGFRTEQGHCGVCRRKWRLTDTDLCLRGETQTMSHIVEFCPLTKLNGGLSRLHSVDEDNVLWLTSYGWWHAYEKKFIINKCNKLWFRHKLMANDTSKTVKISRRWLPTSASPECQCAAE